MQSVRRQDNLIDETECATNQMIVFQIAFPDNIYDYFLCNSRVFYRKQYLADVLLFSELISNSLICFERHYCHSYKLQSCLFVMHLSIVKIRSTEMLFEGEISVVKN